MQQNKRPTSGSELGIDTWTPSVGLAVTIRGFHPQVLGSTPGLWKVLDRSSVSRYIELGFADFTRKSHPQVPGSTPGLGNILEGSSVCWWNKLGFADLTLKSRVRLPDWEILESSTDFHYIEIDSR